MCVCRRAHIYATTASNALTMKNTKAVYELQYMFKINFLIILVKKLNRCIFITTYTCKNTNAANIYKSR